MIICSGAIVFFDSFSHISFASDEIRCMNSAEGQMRPDPSTEVAGGFTDATLDNEVACLARARDVLGQALCKPARVSNTAAGKAGQERAHQRSFSRLLLWGAKGHRPRAGARRVPPGPTSVRAWARPVRRGRKGKLGAITALGGAILISASLCASLKVRTCIPSSSTTMSTVCRAPPISPSAPSLTPLCAPDRSAQSTPSRLCRN